MCLITGLSYWKIDLFCVYAEMTEIKNDSMHSFKGKSCIKYIHELCQQFSKYVTAEPFYLLQNKFRLCVGFSAIFFLIFITPLFPRNTKLTLKCQFCKMVLMGLNVFQPSNFLFFLLTSRLTKSIHAFLHKSMQKYCETMQDKEKNI